MLTFLSSACEVIMRKPEHLTKSINFQHNTRVNSRDYREFNARINKTLSLSVARL